MASSPYAGASSPYAGASSPVQSINPALLSIPSTPVFHGLPDQSLGTDNDLFNQLQQLIKVGDTSIPFPEATQSALPSPTLDQFDELFQNRAHSQPPEHISPPTAQIRARQYRHPYPPASHRHRQSQGPNAGAPSSSSRPLRPSAPTSFPTPEPPCQTLQDARERILREIQARSPASSIEKSKSSTQLLPPSSFLLSLQSHMTNIQKAVASMQTFLSQSISSMDDDDSRRAVEK
ncbi:hypothetical protein MMC19_006581 [Ptychographa xylographoides]|nr:hypothetical protein [Ptychographa xylographoides]